MMRRKLYAVAGALALGLVGVGIGAAVSADSGTTADCTAAPAVVDTEAGSQITVTCVVPKPPPVTVTVTAQPEPSQSPSPTPPPTSSTPTPTPTPTPTVTPSPSTPPPSTPPPSPGGFPDASNTGVPDGTALTAYTGPTAVNTNGTVIDGKTISSSLVINADNVTIRNSRITAGGDYGLLVWGHNFSLVDSEMTGRSQTANIAGYEDRGGGDIHLTRVEGYGGVDIVRMGGDGSTVRDSYFHGVCQPSTCSGAHNDTVGVLPGTRNITVEHNRIDNENSQTAAMEIGDVRYQCSSGRLLNNLIAGGGYTIYSGHGCGGTAGGYEVSGNLFSTKFYPRIGYWGVAYSWQTDGGNTWSGNTYADGPNAGKPVTP